MIIALLSWRSANEKVLKKNAISPTMIVRKLVTKFTLEELIFDKQGIKISQDIKW